MIIADKYDDLVRNELSRLAILQLNKPYEHGSHGLNDFDCAGLVWYLYNEIFGIDLYEIGFGLSTTTMMMTSRYGKITLYKDNTIYKDLFLNTGDILFFHRQSKNDYMPKKDNKYPGHCGIYIGNNNFIHCSRKYNMVTMNNLDKDIYWKKILVGSKDIVSKQKKILL